MSKGLKRLVIFCLICLFLNTMAKGNVDMAGALVETGDNFVSAIKDCVKDVDWGGLFSDVCNGFSYMVDFVKSFV